MEVLAFTVINKEIECDIKQVVGDNDYQASFILDDEWNDKEVICRVVWNNRTSLDIKLEDLSCVIPAYIMKRGEVSIGVYAEGDEQLTTEPWLLSVRKSIREKEFETAMPHKEIWNEINEKIKNVITSNDLDERVVLSVNDTIEKSGFVKNDELSTEVSTQVNAYLGEHGVATEEYVDSALYKTIDERGKNLLCLKDATYESNGVKVVVNDQLITISGTPISTSGHNSFDLDVDIPSVLDGDYYIASHNIVNGGGNGCQNTTRVRVFDTNNTQVGEKSSIYENAGNVVTFENLTNFTIKLLVQAQYTYTEEWSFNLQLEKGGTKTAYEKAYHTCTKEPIVEELSKSVSALMYENENPLEIIKQDGGMLSIFDSITCIGDSLTAGCFEHTETGSTVWTTIEKYSYPANLAKMTGCKVQNYGRSGRTALDGDNSWLTWADSQGWLTADDKTDAYIIALGTNDINVEGGFTGDVTTDIAESYADNAETSVGGYDKIIRRILENQPKAKIFCVCLPHTRNTEASIAVANTSIKAIAELYPDNCYVLDLETYYVQRSDISAYKAKFYNGGHRNAMGYKELANVYATYIDWIIRNNIADFANIQFVETDYSWT